MTRNRPVSRHVITPATLGAHAAATVAALVPLALLVTVVAGPAHAQSGSILDRVTERAGARAATATEQKANQQVDSAVDKTVDCMFNPVECAKKTPVATPAPTGTPPGDVGAAPAVDAKEWYAEDQGQRLGPMPRAQLASLVTSGKVTAATLVWREGLGEWTPAGELTELDDVFEKVPPPLPPKSGPPPLPSR